MIFMTDEIREMLILVASFACVLFFFILVPWGMM